MSDDFDRASDREMEERELNIANARAKNIQQVYSGRCLYCNTELLNIGRFCRGEDCGERWEFEQKVKRIKGF